MIWPIMLRLEAAFFKKGVITAFWPCDKCNLTNFCQDWAEKKIFITRPKSSKDPFLKNSASSRKDMVLGIANDMKHRASAL